MQQMHGRPTLAQLDEMQRQRQVQHRHPLRDTVAAEPDTLPSPTSPTSPRLTVKERIALARDTTPSPTSSRYAVKEKIALDPNTPPSPASPRLTVKERIALERRVMLEHAELLANPSSGLAEPLPDNEPQLTRSQESTSMSEAAVATAAEEAPVIEPTAPVIESDAPLAEAPQLESVGTTLPGPVTICHTFSSKPRLSRRTLWMVAIFTACTGSLCFMNTLRGDFV